LGKKRKRLTRLEWRKRKEEGAGQGTEEKLGQQGIEARRLREKELLSSSFFQSFYQIQISLNSNQIGILKRFLSHNKI
jgi:hypothetical protein